MPFDPFFKGDSGGHQYDVNTWYEHLVSKFTGLTFLQIQSLYWPDYLALRRDAFIYHLNCTDAGKEYLDNAYRLEQTAPDRSSLRKQFQGKE